MEISRREGVFITLTAFGRMAIVSLATMGVVGQAFAFEVAEDGDISVRWDNTWNMLGALILLSELATVLFPPSAAAALQPAPTLMSRS